MCTVIVGSYFKRILTYLFNNALNSLDYLASNFRLQYFVYLSHVMEFIVHQNLLSIKI